MSFSTYFNPKIPILKGNPLVTTTNSAFPSQILFQQNNKPYRNHIMNKFDEVGSSGFMRIGGNPDLRIGVMVAEVEHEEECAREEMKDLMQRLEILLERIRVIEMEKFMMGRATKGEVSDEVREEAEKMSRELINKFLEKPMQYLSCDEVNLEDRVKDLKIVVEILESSCSGKKKKNILSNGQCLRHLFT